MDFCTLSFVLFLVCLAMIYYIVRPAKRWVVLLAGSLIFFAVCGWEYLIYAVVLSLICFFGAIFLDRLGARQSSLDKTKDREEIQKLASKRRKILILTIVIVVGNLVFHKYWNMVGELFNAVRLYLGGTGEAGWWQVALPLGLSYYTFSGLGYLLDVYWKRYPCQKNYIRFLLYIVYFPHIIQGPIERYSLLEGQFFEEQRVRFDWERTKQAILLMGFGYFKKLFVADRIAILVNGVVANPQGTPASMQILAVLFSGAWIYADFSGYMDIARGASMIFGIEINRNFNHPMMARSVSEWWRRWHMSLSSWWRDYIYMPMATSLKFITKCANVKKKFGKSAGKLFKDAVPIFLIWITTGLWHGTGMTYFAWGVYFSILFTCSSVFSAWNRKMAERLHINPESKMFHLFQRVRTYLLFCGGRFLTVFGSLAGSAAVVRNVFVNFDAGFVFQGSNYTQYGTCVAEVWFMLAGIAVMLLADFIEEKKGVAICQWVFERRWFVRSVIYAGLVVAIALFGIYGVDYSLDGFAYQNF